MKQVVYSKLKLRQLNQAANGGAMDTQTTGLTNSMMGGGLGVKTYSTSMIGEAQNIWVSDHLFVQMGSSSAPSSGQSFGHKNYDLVMKSFQA